MIYKDVVFTNIDELENQYPPVPAKNFIPDWYKNTKNTLNNEKRIDKDNFTIKKCVPVLDSITSGYLFLLQRDLYIRQYLDENNEKRIEYKTPSSKDPMIILDSANKADMHPLFNNSGFAKLSFPWTVQTPKGYSCLILPPLHRDNILSILPAIVDTDNFSMQIILPFTLIDKNFNGIIPAGTAIAQILPFKRENWKMKFGNNKNINFFIKTNKILYSMLYDGYKRFFWKQKDYK